MFLVFLVFLRWCQHPARELVLFGLLQDGGFVLVELMSRFRDKYVLVRDITSFNYIISRPSRTDVEFSVAKMLLSVLSRPFN